MHMECCSFPKGFCCEGWPTVGVGMREDGMGGVWEFIGGVCVWWGLLCCGKDAVGFVI